mmetsp:Transcript_147347/g.274575  ORF Transcript_147347/g.274575 Transcript_147347/m.274575 type:complete len:432 (+) Transcript_147347:41-1336(+)
MLQPSPGVGADKRADESLYQAFSLLPSASGMEVQNAYFELASPYHPDLCHPNDTAAAREFLRLSEAFWVLGDARRRDRYDSFGEVDLELFSVDVVMQWWVQEMLTADPGIDELIGEELQCLTEAECVARFLDAHSAITESARGDDAQKQRRLRCKLCGFRMRGRELLHAHLKDVHALDARNWAEEILASVRMSFDVFACTATGNAGLDQGHGFALYDGSRAAFKDATAVTGDEIFSGSLESAFDSLLQVDDPCSADAVASALGRVPQDVTNMLMKLHQIEPDLASFLAPLSKEEPVDLERLARARRPRRRLRGDRGGERGGSSQRGKSDSPSRSPSPGRTPSRSAASSAATTPMRGTGSKKSSRRSSRREGQGSGQSPGRSAAARSSTGGGGGGGDGALKNCSCGFTAGTAAALERHLARFPGDPQHEPVT